MADNKLHADIIFIDYIDVIRTPWIEVFKFILENADDLEGLLDFRYMPNSPDRVKAWSILRNDQNPLYSFGTDNYDYDDMLETIMNKIPLLYDTDDTLLDMGNFISIMSGLPTTKKVILYSPVYDERISYDIRNHYNYGAIDYVYGEFCEVVRKTRPNTFMLNSIEKLNALISDNLGIVKNSTVLVSKHRYNFELDEKTNALIPLYDDGVDVDFLEKHGIDFAFFSTITLGSDAFTPYMIFDNDKTFYLAEDMEEFNKTHYTTDEMNALYGKTKLDMTELISSDITESPIKYSDSASFIQRAPSGIEFEEDDDDMPYDKEEPEIPKIERKTDTSDLIKELDNIFNISDEDIELPEDYIPEWHDDEYDEESDEN